MGSGEITDQKLELARYLEAVAGLYPYGVPSQVMRPNKPTEVRPVAVPNDNNVVFIGLAENPEQAGLGSQAEELLRMAMAKGFKRSNESFVCLNAKSAGKNAPEISKASQIVLLGQKVWNWAGLSQDLKRGGVVTWQGKPTLLTHTINDVIGNLDRKREFWSDLKKFFLTP